MSSALDFFANIELSSQKCDSLELDYEKSLAWENENTSVHSRGIVIDCEELARNIFSPIHVDEKTGELTPFAFDDVLNKGLSVIRLSYLNPADVVLNGKQKLTYDHSIGKTERQYLGYITARASYIRMYIDENSNKRALAIYDTAMEDLVAHADICRIIRLSKTQKTQIRNYLRSEFSQLISIN